MSTQTFYETITPGTVKIGCYLNCQEVLGMLSRMAEIKGDTLILKHWTTLPTQPEIIKTYIERVAEVALMIWPYWYGRSQWFQLGATADQVVLNDLRAAQLQQTIPQLSLPWLKAAISKCLHSKTPILDRFSPAVQLIQLGLAVDPKALMMGLVIEDPQPQPAHLLGLARAASWLAATASIRVMVLGTDDLKDHPELDSIAYGAVLLDQEVISTTHEETLNVTWGVRGVPHPFSPGEQKLAPLLATDSELTDLFGFNEMVTTERGSVFKVDLLWPEGKVVVEIDGYRHHGNQFAFRADRNRDYELLISGYSVLRLAHDEVVADPIIALEKIRDVVRFRRR